MAKKTFRSEVPVELTWNLEDLFVSSDAWEKELSAVQADIPMITQYKGRFGEGAQVLLDCLNAQEELYKRI